MSRDRFFIEGVHALGERVALAPGDARKIVTVLRRQSGEGIEVIDAAGNGFTAVLSIDGKAVAAELRAPLADGQIESASRIVVAQAIPKGQKMDFIVEKATELGVATIVPLRSERVVGDRTGEHKRERWQRIAQTAAQQSGRTRVPRVEASVGWSELIATFAHYERIFVPWEGADHVPLRESFGADLRSASAVLVVIGPEGGFSATEIARVVAAGARPVSLGRRILRTETAALVVLAALLYERGEL